MSISKHVVSQNIASNDFCTLTLTHIRDTAGGNRCSRESHISTTLILSVRERRVESARQKQVGAQTVRLRAESRGDAKPDLTKKGLPMDPIASLTAAGEVKWDDELVEEIKKLGTPPPEKKIRITKSKTISRRHVRYHAI